MTLCYFIPDWDDRVDPGYNFETDEHTPGRNPDTNDVYAHEIFDDAPYDGVLLSLATLSANKKKRLDIAQSGGVHRFLRLPQDSSHQVLGDCGAFSYWQEYEPPYRTQDVLKDYHDLGFDLGVSVDHLIFAEIAAEKERRWNLTLTNAEDFLQEHQRAGYRFTPVGVAQGWDPASYQRAAAALVGMGYKYIAVGGLVRNTTDSILQTLRAVQEILPAHMQVHLFGVNRPEYVSAFGALGVTSFDSASWLRRAWMDGRVNYFLENESFAAIRIPDSVSLARRRVREMRKADDLERLGRTTAAQSVRLRWLEQVNQAEVCRRERHALAALRAYDRDSSLLAEAFGAVQEYARIAGELSEKAPGQLTDRVLRDYYETLLKRPWERCECAICRHLRVEVIIFRGNNRNRRRGFHNTWQLYRKVQLETMGALSTSALAQASQLNLWR